MLTAYTTHIIYTDMKKLFYIIALVIAASLAFSSCTKNDEGKKDETQTENNNEGDNKNSETDNNKEGGDNNNSNNTENNNGGDEGDDQTKPSGNVLVIRGSELPILISVYAIYEEEGEGYVNFDVDAGPDEDHNLHGYGGFDAAWIGKTTQLEGNFFLSFNPMEGPSIDPVIKSGTVTVTQVAEGKLRVEVDAVETNGEAFKLYCNSYDETKIDWDNFKYE